MVERKCIVCKKRFYTYLAAIKKTTNSGSHCSNDCRRKRIINKCQYCYDNFEVRVSEARLKFCSRNCYYQGRRVSRDHYLERTKVKRRNRVARIYEAMGDFSIDYFNWLCKQLKNECVLCKKRFSKLTIDHMTALTKGGKHDNSNIQPLCGSCNAKKGNHFNFSDPRVKELYAIYTTIF